MAVSTTDLVRFELRLPAWIDARLKLEASNGDRSKNAQIVRILRAHYQEAPDEREENSK